MRIRLIPILALSLLFSALSTKAADVSVEVVPSSSGGVDKQRISIWDTFYVILTNTSQRDLLVWQESCSWGYFNLSFEFTDKNGKTIKVQKLPVVFTKNSPNGFVILSGKHFVLPVVLFAKDKNFREWTNVGELEGPMTVKAIYKCTNEAFPGEKPNPANKYSDVEQKEFDMAWVGQVESEPMQVTINR